MGYILPNPDQGCFRQSCTGEMWAVGMVRDALSRVWDESSSTRSSFPLDIPQKEVGPPGVTEV